MLDRLDASTVIFVFLLMRKRKAPPQPCKTADELAREEEDRMSTFVTESMAKDYDFEKVCPLPQEVLDAIVWSVSRTSEQVRSCGGCGSARCIRHVLDRRMPKERQ